MSLIWIEIAIGFAVPMAWGVWQLLDLRREARKDAAKQSTGPSRDAAS